MKSAKVGLIDDVAENAATGGFGCDLLVELAVVGGGDD